LNLSVLRRFWALAGLCLALISTSATAEPRLYDSVRGWNVWTVGQGREFLNCYMERSGNQFDLLLSRDFTGQWQVGFPTSAQHGAPVTIDLDVGRYSDVMEGYTNRGVAWANVAPDFVEIIAKENDMSVMMQGYGYDVSLSGTYAGALKIVECANQQGQMAAAPAPTPSQPVESGTARMGAGCPAYGSYRSPDVQDAGEIEFVNYTDRAISIIWIDYDGNNQEMAGLTPGESIKYDSPAGHYWLAKDFDGTCHGGVLEVGYPSSYYEIR